MAGTTTSFSVSGGPGNAADWVGLYAVGAPDTARLTFFFLNGTQTAPQTGVTEATLQAHVPLTAGDYEWRLFANNGLTKLATSGIVTVTASPATLRVNGIAPPTAVTVGAAAPVELTMTDGPGLPGDAIGLYRLGSPDTLVESHLFHSSGTTSATKYFVMPVTAGEYEFRFLAEAGGVLTRQSVTVTSSNASFTVNGVAAPNATSVVAGTTTAFSIANTPGNRTDWIGLYPVGAADTARVAFFYLSGTQWPPSEGLTSAAFASHVPVTPGDYEWRLFANNGLDRLMTSGVMTVTASPAILRVNGLATSNVNVVPGSTVVLTLQDGPGLPGDTIALYRTGSTDTLVQSRLFDSATPPTGVTTATLNFLMPETPGSYEFRFLAEGGGVLTRRPITVQPPTTTLSVNGVAAPEAVSVTAGTVTAFAVTDGPGNVSDWVGLFAVGAPDTARLSFVFLSGTQTVPTAGLTAATFPVHVPVTPGQYEWRLFASGGLSRLATSGVMTVAASPTTLRVNGSASPVSLAVASPVVLSMENGPGLPGDAIGLYRLGTPDTLIESRLFSASGATSATLNFVLPITTGTYEFRFLAEGGGVLTRQTVTVTASTATIAINGVTGPSPTTVVAGTTTSFALADGPGNVADWVGWYQASAADTARLGFFFLNNTQIAPTNGITATSFQTHVPLVPGDYEWRFFANNGLSRLTKSGVVTVSASPARLRVNGAGAPAQVAVTPGASVVLTLQDGPGLPGDAAGLYRLGTPDVYIESRLFGASGVTSATLNFTMPTTVGNYEFRFLAEGGGVLTRQGVIVAPPLSTPTLSVASGTYESERAVVVSSSDAGAVLHYTQSGDDPTEADATISSGSTINVTQSQVLKVRAFGSGSAPSPIASATYTLRVATPEISPNAGSFTTPQSVTILTATPGATIRYTVDGSEPGIASALYSQALIIDATTTVKAKAFRSNWSDSAVASTTLTVTGTLSTPVAAPPAGWIQPTQTITLTAAPGAEIRYTLDGTTPSATSTLYSTPVTIPAHNTTLKARAFRTGWTASNSSSDLYRFDTAAVRVVSFTPAASAMGVRNEAISATFNAAMDPASLTESTIVLESVLGEYALYATPSYNATTRTVTLLVDDWIEPLALHRVRIVGGAGGVRSATGLLLDEDLEWTFTAASDDGVGGAWGFEEGAGTTTADNSGNGNTGTLLGPSWNAGRYGGALAFDGVDDRVRIADAETLDISNRVSIAAWIKPSSVGSLSVILSKESAAADHSYALWLNSSGQLSANFVLSGNTFAATTTNAIAANVWTYVVATYNGATIRLYVNGAEVASTSASGAFENTTRPLWIGGDQSAGHYFAGQIDEVRLFDYKLAASEISDLMATPVKPVQSATKVAGGEGHTLIAKIDGTVWAWGENGNGQLGDGSTSDRTTPYQIAGLTNIVAISAGRNHSMALAADGTAYAWGSNASGQIGADTQGADQRTPLALPLTTVKAIAAGELFSLVLRTNGDVYAFGRNANGQFGVGTIATTIAEPTLVATGVSAIAAGFDHSVIVKGDGTVWTSGRNDSGQLGDGSTTQSASWVQMIGVVHGVVATAGAAHTVVLLTNGTLMTVGLNASGQLGDSTTVNMRSTAVPIHYFDDVTVIAAGANHTIATTADGTAWAWGENTFGQLGINSTTMTREPWWILSNAAHIGAGYHHTVAVTSGGTVYSWGSNASGQLGNGLASAVSRVAPAEISKDDYAWRVATPTFSPDGGLFNNDQLVTLASATPDDPGLPVTIRYTVDGSDPTESSTAATGAITIDHSLVIKARAWKGNMPSSDVNTASFSFQAAQPTVSTPAATYTSALDDVQFLSATQGAQIRYTTNLTDPTASSPLYTGPIDISHTTTYRIAAFKAGYAPSAVTMAHYTMNFGTLTAPVVEPVAGTYLGSVTVSTSTSSPGTVYYTANSTTTAGDAPNGASISTSPFTFTTTTTIRARSIHPDYTTSADTTRTYIIKANNPTLSAAGGSYAPGSVVIITADQPSVDILRMTIDGSEPSDLSPSIASGSSILLGNFTLKVRAFRDDEDDIDSDTATAAYTLTALLGPGSASAGGAHSMLATPDGRVYAWGRNASGQLGIDSTIDKTSPTMLNTITGVTSISSGAAHTLARTWDGQVYAWGSNGSGRLGDGSSTSSASPVHVWALSNVVAVAAGDTHSLALTSDGHVYSWGENSDGQLGVGSTFDAWTPTLINSLTNVVAIAAGGTHSLAVTASGQLYAWGNNASSRLGDATTTDRTSPVLLGISDVAAIAAGGAHSVAMTSSGALYSWGLGTSGQLGLGTATSSATPQLIPGVHASAIAAGGSHSAAIRHDGVLVAWGAGTSGQIGDGATAQRNAPVVVNGPASVSTLTLGNAHSMVVTPTGDIWTWGEVDFGRLGDGATQDRVTPATITLTVAGWAPAAPTIDIASGVFTTAQTVTVVSSDAAIRYTVDGAEPTESDPEVPANGVLDISSPTQLRARVFATGRVAGPTARANYVLQPPAPIIDPPSGSYLTAQTVTIWGSASSSVVRYTLNGAEPTAISTLYDVPFAVSATTVVKAKEFPTNGWTPSATSTSSLVFNGGAMELPTATPAGGIYSTAPQVSLSSSAGASIRYTLNGTTPTASSTLYTGPITIPAAGATLKSIAFHPTLPASAMRTDVYVIDTTAPTISAQYQPGLLNAWSRTPVEVSFVCGDNAQLAFCSPPMTFLEDGAGQTITGTAIDSVGRQTSLPVTVNLDFTPPTVTLSSPVNGATTTNTTLQVTGEVADALSGLASVKCNDVNATVTSGALSCQVPLRPGRNVVVISARDVAGNATSQGVTVTLVGTVTSLTMTPSARTMVVGETATLSVRDAFGVEPTGTVWQTSDAAIVSLSEDNPPVLTALAAGTASITVWKGSIGTQSQITVAAGDTLPAGTVRWRLPTATFTPGRTTAPIYTLRMEENGPEFFTVEPNFTTSPAQYTVRAASNEGAVLWKEAAPGMPLMGDSYGALIAGVQGEYRCAQAFGEDRFCFKALVRFGVSGETVPWRYDSAGYLDRPAQGPDGTIYAIEHINGSRSVGALNDALHDIGNNKSVVMLDGETGQVTARVALPSATSTGPNATSYYEPKSIGPIVGGDGNAYVIVGDGTQVTSESWTLLQLSRQGQMSGVPICSVSCGSWKVFQLVPDGVGGLLVRVTLTTGGQLQGRLIRFDSAWQRTEHVIGVDTRIDLVGKAGTIYLQTRVGTDDYYGVSEALDVTNFTTKWTRSPGWNLVGTETEGRTAAVNSSQQLLHLDDTGELIETIPLSVVDPIQVLGAWIGQGSAELKSVIADFIDTTRYDSTISHVGVALIEPRGFGRTTQQSAAQTDCDAPPLSAKNKGWQPGSVVKWGTADSGVWTLDRLEGMRDAFRFWQDALAPSLGTRFQEVQFPEAKFRFTLGTTSGPDVWTGGTLISLLPTPGRVISGQLIITDDSYKLSGYFGYLKMTLHEIGHSLGLADAFGKDRRSVMNQFSKDPSQPKELGGWRDDPKNNIAFGPTSCDVNAVIRSSKR